MLIQKQHKWLFSLLVVWMVLLSKTALADLSKHDIEEIRKIVREEIQYVDKRIDGLDKRIDGLDKSLNVRIDDLRVDMNSRIKEMQELMLWGFGILFAGMFSLVSFVLWDRRTALSPAIRKAKELEEEEERLKKALREYSYLEPRMATALKQVGLM